MGTMTVSLPESLSAFVDEQVAACGYATGGDYVHELISKERDRQRLRALLLKGADSPLGPPIDSAYFDGLRERVRRAGREP